ncbi:hypothetical protein NM688_g6144 [Phlebia brevispora]|uniref:Uncharacterized protein n=1 Tax=Phlebia brevispora TaxID=194682 RepID=A0ACC1SJQ8_9APHY|nr:hypothetical protein NM688_g6144 [Phlebia brevispora]
MRLSDISRQTYPVDDFCFAEYNRPVDTIEEHEGLGAVRKPDILGLRRSVARKLVSKKGARTKATVRWTDILLVLEVKFRNADLLEVLNNVREQRNLEGIAPDGTSEKKKRKPAKKPKGKRSKAAQIEPPSQGDLLEPFRTKGIYPSKGAVETNELDGVSAAVQTASYALELLSCTYGTRQFSLGIILKDDTISLWYYDASGIVYSTDQVSMIKNFEIFAAIIVGFACCTCDKFGIFPTSVLQPHIPYTHQFPPRNLEEGTIVIPHPRTKEQINITMDQCLFTQYILIGRRTFLYTVDTDPMISKNKLIMKVSYQVSTRRKEYELVGIAKKAKVRHLPQIHLWGDLWQLSDGVRDIFLQKNNRRVKYEDRVLRAIVYTRYSSIRPLFSENILLIPVMVDQMIDCLSDLWYKANILHRDISVNNIMYEKRGDYYHFVLIDFDMAIELPNGDVSSYVPSSKHRTGTLPFMAHELIEDAFGATRIRFCEWKPKRHVLYHDMQSLFWVSVWCGLVLFRYLLSAEEQERLLGFLRKWESTDMELLEGLKFKLTQKSISDWNIPIPAPIRAIESWLDAWTAVFNDVNHVQSKRRTELKRADAEGRESTPFDEDTVGGSISPQVLKDALSPFMPFKQKESAMLQDEAEELSELSAADHELLTATEENDRISVHDAKQGEPVDKPQAISEERTQDQIDDTKEAMEAPAGKRQTRATTKEAREETVPQVSNARAVKRNTRANAKKKDEGEVDETAHLVSEAPAAKRQTRATAKRKADGVDEPADHASQGPAVKRKTRASATKKAGDGVNKTTHHASEAPAQKPPPQRQTRKRARPQEQEVSAENDIRARLRPRRKIA